MDAFLNIIQTPPQKYNQDIAQSGYMDIGKPDPKAEKFSSYMEKDVQSVREEPSQTQRSESKKTEPDTGNSNYEKGSGEAQQADQEQTKEADATSGQQEANKTTSESSVDPSADQSATDLQGQDVSSALEFSMALLNLTQVDGSQVPEKQSQAVVNLQQGADVLAVHAGSGLGTELQVPGLVAVAQSADGQGVTGLSSDSSAGTAVQGLATDQENALAALKVPESLGVSKDAVAKTEDVKAEQVNQEAKGKDSAKAEQKPLISTETGPQGSEEQGQDTGGETQSTAKDVIDPAKMQKTGATKEKAPDFMRLDQVNMGQNSQSLSANASAKPVSVAAGLDLPDIATGALAVQIATQAQNGNKRFDIRLDPPELGRIEVRLDVTKDGTVHTHIAVEKSETLDLMQRDSRQLERALNNAGLDTKGGNLSFSLKDQGFAGHDQGQNERNSSSRRGVPEIEETIMPQYVANSYRPIGYRAGLDIRI